jgi:hypothetical protein
MFCLKSIDDNGLIGQLEGSFHFLENPNNESTKC